MQDKIMLTVTGGDMQCYVAQPQSAAGAGVIVLQEAFGVNDHIRRVADRFADEGYLAIAPELFHRTAPAGFEGSYDDFSAIMPHFQGITEAGLEEDIAASYDWLRAQGVGTIGSVGYCMGGRASFLANAVLPLQAAVSYYGGRIAETLLPRAAEQQGPLLMFWGGQDKHITPESVKSVADALRAAGKPFINIEFSEADHGFNCDDRPSFNSEASAHAWAITLRFFKTHLGC